MASKPKTLAVVRIEHEGGSVNMAKLGQTVGVYGINIVALSKDFNAATAAHRGLRVAADVTVFEDKTFQVQVKTPATASLILRAAGVAKGSGRPNSQKIGSISQRQLAEIAAVKMPDLDAPTPEAAQKIIAGTARSMGIQIVG
ncbi:large subunit ribosomal protein L11 [Catenulispora sp. MAP5-51]|uniref:uL11 family ribosomal protein n=1 Tax=Catenulispora sp. MAP5-51 TaxID=3156298 RepID=UPI0035142D48